MMSDDDRNHDARLASGRLNGWKEIASYFGKGVRTVQRWEKEVGLPVHRIGTGGGEVVYALVPELEEWQQSAEARKAANDQAYAASGSGRESPVAQHTAAGGTRGAEGPAPSDPKARNGAEGPAPSDPRGRTGVEGPAPSDPKGRNGAEGPAPSGPRGRNGAEGPAPSGPMARTGVEGPAPSGPRGRTGAEGPPPSDPRGRTGVEGPPPSDPRASRTRRFAIAMVAVLGVAVLGALAWAWLGGPAAPGVPASGKLIDNGLAIFDADGRFLWDYRFDFDFEQESYDQARRYRRELVEIVDLDADGRKEVLFVPNLGSVASHGLFCFESDGTLRFRHQSERVVTYGASMPVEIRAAPPWLAAFVRVSGEPGRPREIWLVSYYLHYFPTLVERLDSSGKVLDEYWANGRVYGVNTVTLGERQVVLVGGIANEFKGGSLAVLDAAQPSGMAPAERADYRCEGCPPVASLAFLVFPRLDVAVVSGFHASVEDPAVDGHGRILVSVFHGSRGSGDPEVWETAASHYVLDSSFRVIRAEVGEFYRQIHQFLERRGLLDHPFDLERESRDLWPVRRWDATKSMFQEIFGPEGSAG